MKKVITRGLLGVAAVGLPLGASLTLPMVAGATLPVNPGVVTVDTQTQADQWMAQGVINKNVDVPAGANVQLRWVDIKGNLSVEGKLSLASSQIEGNAYVSGPGAGLSLFNAPGNHFYGNLTVYGAGGYYDNSNINTGLGVYSNGQQVDGNLIFANNTGSQMNLSGSMTVNRNFIYALNAHAYGGGLTVSGHSFIF